jgi:uncharacterized membrane protein (DUF485 family)
MTKPAPRSPEAIAALPEYQQLLRSRNRLGRFLTVLMLLGYFGFIGLVAFNKEWLAQPLADGMVTTVAFAVALGVMVLTLITTGIYVYRANTHYDTLTRKIVEAAQ